MGGSLGGSGGLGKESVSGFAFLKKMDSVPTYENP